MTERATSLPWGTYRKGGEGRGIICHQEQLRHAPPPRVLLLCAPRRSGKSAPITGVRTWLHGRGHGEKSLSLVTSLPEATLHFKGFWGIRSGSKCTGLSVVGGPGAGSSHLFFAVGALLSWRTVQGVAMNSTTCGFTPCAAPPCLARPPGCQSPLRTGPVHQAGGVRPSP